MAFSAKLRARLEAGECPCWDCLRRAGLTPPRILMRSIPGAPAATPGAHGFDYEARS